MRAAAVRSGAQAAWAGCHLGAVRPERNVSTLRLEVPDALCGCNAPPAPTDRGGCFAAANEGD